MPPPTQAPAPAPRPAGLGGAPQPLDAATADADIKAMITRTKAVKIGLGVAVAVAPLAFVAGGQKCPADPVPCDPFEGLVHVFGTSTATGGPGIIALPLDYAAAEVVVDLDIMRRPMSEITLPVDA